MREYKRKNVKIINEMDADVFESRLNSFLNALADSRVEYELKFNDNLGLCAYVVFSVAESVPESIGEGARLSGATDTCMNCAYYSAPADGRIKYTLCPIEHCRVSAWQHCCDNFYAHEYPRKKVVAVNV